MRCIFFRDIFIFFIRGVIIILNLLAKSDPIETIRQHTDRLLKDYSDLMVLYGDCFNQKEKEMIKIACEYHDYGKAIFPFQKLLNNEKIALDGLTVEDKSGITKYYDTIVNNNRIPHGYLSPAFIDAEKLKEKFSIDEMKIIFSAIYHHHVRNFEINTNAIINNDLSKRFPDKKLNKKFTKFIIDDFSKILNREEFWNQYAVVLGVLNRLDYHASSHIETQIEISPIKNSLTICDLVTNKIIEEYKSLRDVQVYMKSCQHENLVVTASTGLGKTEAALLWTGGGKTFYTLPLKVSINAIYERIKSTYNYEEKVTLLHSDAMSYLFDETEENENSAILKYKTTRFFSYPLTVCTIDQLFLFVYKYKGCEQMLATLKYSKLIIDEIQSYTPKIVAKIIYGLKLITGVGGKFAIITATMPPIFEHFLLKSEIKFEKPQKAFLSTQKARHFICYKECEFDFDLILSKSKNNKILIICNTVNKAQEVYNELKDKENVHLLHSRFIKKHRKILEDNILAFDKDKNIKNGIWISTQIVEASLDIDFDFLFTEMCTADSLLQRLGRCYRQREYNKSEPNIYIFDDKNGYGTVYEYEQIYDHSVQFIQQYNNKIFSEEEKINYVNEVYDTEALKKTNGLSKNFYDDIKKEIENLQNNIPWIISKNESQKEFRGINSITIIPESIYRENNKREEITKMLETIFSHKTSVKESRMATEQLLSLTISVDEFSKIGREAKKEWQLIDKSGNLKIYRLDFEYDFDEQNHKGAGLLDKNDKQNFL